MMNDMQQTAVNRNFYGVRSTQILDISGGQMLFDDGYGETSFPLPGSGRYKKGDWIDIVACRTGDIGVRVQFLGHTPPEFIPAHTKG